MRKPLNFGSNSRHIQKSILQYLMQKPLSCWIICISNGKDRDKISFSLQDFPNTTSFWPFLSPPPPIIGLDRPNWEYKSRVQLAGGLKCWNYCFERGYISPSHQSPSTSNINMAISLALPDELSWPP